MTKPVCPCQISSSGNFYRHHVPDCPNAVPSAAPVVTESGEYDRARYLHMMRQSVPVPDAVVSQPEGTRELPDDHIKHVKAFLLEMYQTMVDPVEEFQGNGIAELCQLLLKRAREDREALASPTPAVSASLQGAVAHGLGFHLADGAKRYGYSPRTPAGDAFESGFLFAEEERHRLVVTAPPSLPKAAFDPTRCEVHGVTMESCRLDKREGCRPLPKAGETEKVNNGQN